MSQNNHSFQDRFIEVAGKIGSQRHLVAIRDAFVAMMPITMAGSIAVLLNVFFRDLPNSWEWTGFVETVQPLIDINGYVYFGTIAILAMVYAFSFGYNLSESYNVNALGGGLVSFASFIATLPQIFNISTDISELSPNAIEALANSGFNVITTDGVTTLVTSEWGSISTNYVGATGLFASMIISLIATEVYCLLMRREITIKMPDSVPPAVTKAFASIIPGAIAIYISSIIAYLVFRLTGMPLGDVIAEFIQQPLMGLSQGLGSVLLLSLLIQLFWFFGLHGHNVLAPIQDGLYLPALSENLAVYEATKDISQLPYIWTRGSFDAYSQMGGSGVTLALIIAIFIFSKRENEKAVAKMSAPMGMFNINEPIIFGLPIVLNPTYLVPWLITPAILNTIAYLATSWGLVPPVYVQVPWVMPPVLYAFLATGGSWRAALLSLFNIVLAVLIYAPFVISSNRIYAKELEKSGNIEV